MTKREYNFYAGLLASNYKMSGMGHAIMAEIKQKRQDRKSAGRITGPQRKLTFVVHFEAFHLVLTRQRFSIVIAQRLQILQILQIDIFRHVNAVKY